MIDFVICSEVQANQRIILNIPKDYFVVVMLTSQTVFGIRLRIEDDEGTIYFDEIRESLQPMPVMSDAFYARTDSLALSFTVPDQYYLDARMDLLDIKNESGELVSRTRTIVADNSGSGRYTALLLTITAWKGRG